VEAVLDALARLHARYWRSERFGTDLAWVETHLQGPLSEFMYGPVTQLVAYEAVHERFKRELLERINVTPEELLAMQRRLHQHQSRLPQTLLHGDAHIGNTFRYPDGRAGLLDWQLLVRGYHMHDIAYTITSALSTASRRAKERELVAYYLDRLRSLGVAEPPSLERSMVEFGRTLVWCLYIGWLTVPLINYGWEITLLNHLRIVAAYEDHQTAKLIAEID
jgi:Ser/Thr protein kinase RdoA (MazF antagonist)